MFPNVEYDLENVVFVARTLSGGSMNFGDTAALFAFSYKKPIGELAKQIFPMNKNTRLTRRMLILKINYMKLVRRY